MVYFVQGRKGSPIKIGTTTRLRARLRRLEAEFGCRLRVLAIVDGDRVREHELHRRFGALRLDGERFRAGPELLEFIGREGRPWADHEDDAEPAKLTIQLPAELARRFGVHAEMMRMSYSELFAEMVKAHCRRFVVHDHSGKAGKGVEPASDEGRGEEVA